MAKTLVGHFLNIGNHYLVYTQFCIVFFCRLSSMSVVLHIFLKSELYQSGASNVKESKFCLIPANFH